MKKLSAASLSKAMLKIILLKSVFRAFQKTAKTEEIIKRLEKAADEDKFARIRCPLCAWKPTAASRWYCSDCDAPEYFYGGCNTAWNTFETRGKCPTCAHQWRWTSCLKCHGWAKHEEWYEKD